MTGWPTFEEQVEEYIAWKTIEAVDQAVKETEARCLGMIAFYDGELARLSTEKAELRLELAELERERAQLEAARG